MAIPPRFGYKDICKLFKAAKFDQAQADRLVELYKRVGARYVVPVAVHHDNFDMWDSKFQPRFNSVATSGKDIVGHVEEGHRQTWAAPWRGLARGKDLSLAAAFARLRPFGTTGRGSL